MYVSMATTFNAISTANVKWGATCHYVGHTYPHTNAHTHTNTCKLGVCQYLKTLTLRNFVRVSLSSLSTSAALCYAHLASCGHVGVCARPANAVLLPKHTHTGKYTNARMNFHVNLFILACAGWAALREGAAVLREGNYPVPVYVRVCVSL